MREGVGWDGWLVRSAGLFVYAVALHSGLLGAAMALAPTLVLDFAGFEPAPNFFVRQGGVFHVVLALVYALEWRRRQRLGAMLVAKSCASFFLAFTVLAGESQAWAVKLSLAGDLAMAVAAVLIAGALARSGGLEHRPG